MKKVPPHIQEMDKKQIADLFEELQIHQIELELQNEELITTQQTLEESRFRYVHLFNDAPVGYVILDGSGMVKHFNTTFFTMIPGLEIKKSGQAFADFLVKEDAEKFRARFKALYKSPLGKQIESRMKTGTNKPFHVLLETRHYSESKGESPLAEMNELLLTITDINELQRTKARYKSALNDIKTRERETEALLKATHCILEPSEFQTTAQEIFAICAKTIGAQSGYLALLSEDGTENQVLFFKDDGQTCAVDPALPKLPVSGLVEQAYRTGQVIHDNYFMNSDWAKSLPKGHIRLENIIVAPLIVDAAPAGVMGFANKGSDFTDKDIRIVRGFEKLTAIALKNTRLKAEQDLAEKAKTELIAELRDALANVKKLSGLIPICSHCKKIRDDQGYWNQLEDYLLEHSDATFSHGICQECADLHYPDIGLYDDENDPE